jgi:hypothetical protein
MKLLRFLPALLALATGAFAQDNNNAKLALAHEAIAAMHADKMFDGLAAQMKQMATQMAPMPAGATPEQRQAMETMQGKIMDLSMEAAKGMLTQMDQVYADVYSEAELKAMKAFFLSPEGQSMMAKQPQVMQHVMPLIQSMQRDLMPKIQKLVEETKASVEAAKAKPADAAAPTQK